MEKRIIALMLALVMMLAMAACGSQTAAPAATEAPAAEPAATEAAVEEVVEEPAAELESTVVRVAYGPGSGHVFSHIAEDKGFFADEGLTVELVPITGAVEAFTALKAGQVDVVATYGTNRPLQYIAAGEDVTIFAGYMTIGAMPIACRPGTDYKDITSFIGSTVAGNATYYPMTGVLLDMGYDPVNEIEWIDMSNYIDRIEAVRSGEADYAITATGRESVILDMGLEVCTWLDELLPDYSCCRVACNTPWLNENPNTAKALLKAWLRAQQVFESEPEYAIQLTADAIDAEYDYCEMYMTSEHYDINVDPYKKAVLKAWDYMERLDLLTAEVNIEDHINTEIYLEALNECEAKYGAEDPEFYAEQRQIFADYDEGI